MNHPVFRQAVMADVGAIAGIMTEAVERMLAEGKRQWDHTYPTSVHITADIERGEGYVLEIDGCIVAYGAIVLSGEPAYDNLDGQWLTRDDADYVVVHRLAVSTAARGGGLGAKFFSEAERFASARGVKSFRIDTNYDNYAMLHILDKCGFTYCGEVLYGHGSRRAFEKIIEK